MNKTLLFEIGTEEMPSKYMPNALKHLEKITGEKLKENRINFSSIQVLGTPRRLTVLAYEVAPLQEDLDEIVKGPSLKIAYDAEKNPSKALQGFLRGQGAEISDIIVQELSGVDYVYVKKQQKGQETELILKKILPEILMSFTFPKSMQWGGKSFRFARPVRWLLPLLGEKLIEFNQDDIACARTTYGHRVLSSGDIVINHADEYVEKLRNAYVIVNQEERRELIKKQCIKLAQDIGATAYIDEELLEEVVYLVEYPTALIGNFEEHYLKLPKEAIITPMKEHQRYFPVFDLSGKLMNCFITIRNGDNRSIALVAQGNERVLRARLADAQFFFDEDKKHPLEYYAEKLKTVVFQETLGTVADKTIRIKSNCTFLCKELKLNSEQEAIIQRAADLAKADLTTNMVKEFTELQGIMGKEYAILQGEKESVGQAILEHYMPKNADGNVASTIEGAVLAIADKIDTIAGCFAIDILPTGSQDPYALRRQSIGIITTILEHKIYIDFSSLIDIALSKYDEKNLIKDIKNTKEKLNEFFKARFKNVLIDKGFDYDVVDAVLAKELMDINDTMLRIMELAKWKKEEQFTDIISAFNRISNLAGKANSNNINTEMLTEKAEKDLNEAYNKINIEFDKYLNNKDYYKALEQIILLKEPIDNFFDTIMVMVDDEKIKNNRLALLKSITDMINQYGDLNSIVV